VVLSADKLTSIVDMLITAVQNGELDEHLVPSKAPKAEAAATRR
jgi:hypothetical protein